MDRIIASIALALLFAVLATSVTAEASLTARHTDEALLMKRERAWAQSAGERDIALFRSFMADDYVELILQPATATQKAIWVSATKDAWTDLLRSGHERQTSRNLAAAQQHISVAGLNTGGPDDRENR
jgi:hypothetical protein